MINCANCHKRTYNPKFCNTSCAAIFNNKLRPNRGTSRKCIICQENTMSCYKSRCDKHQEEYLVSMEEKIKLNDTETLGEFFDRFSKNGKNYSFATFELRKKCKIINKDKLIKPCHNCGYSKHVELCHIKPICKFENNDLVKEIHDPENIIQLCRNCHWLFDHGKLNLNFKKKEE